MALSKRLIRNEFGEPELRITVQGGHDIYRLAWHLQFGQCEFAALGRRIHASLARFLGRNGWQTISAYYGGEPRLMVSEEIRNAARALLATVADRSDEELTPEMRRLRRAMEAKPKPVESMWAKPA